MGNSEMLNIFWRSCNRHPPA